MDENQLSDRSAKGSRPDTRRTQGEPCSATAVWPRYCFQNFSKADRVHHTDCYGLRGGRIIFSLTFGNEVEREGRVSAFAKRRPKMTDQGSARSRERETADLSTALRSGRDDKFVAMRRSFFPNGESPPTRNKFVISTEESWACGPPWVMKTPATAFRRKGRPPLSSRAKPRDLRFRGPFLEMFFDRAYPDFLPRCFGHGHVCGV
jgi:hypothetical protein